MQNPGSIHILFPAYFLQIIDRHEIHCPSERSRKSSDACRIYQSEQKLAALFTFSDVSFPNIFQH